MKTDTKPRTAPRFFDRIKYGTAFHLKDEAGIDHETKRVDLSIRHGRLASKLLEH